MGKVVTGKAGDIGQQTIAFAVAGAVMGFFVWNFPVGLIFMGDGGTSRAPLLFADQGANTSMPLSISCLNPCAVCHRR